MVSSTSRWSVGLAAWIIQDGNYGDFTLGDRAEFALEFYTQDDLEHLEDAPASAAHVRDDEYDVVGQVVHVDDGGWVLDFGLLAYREISPPSGLLPGNTIRARIGLSVDPFMYFERLSNDPAYPDLIYTWDVRAIRQETAPFVRRGDLLLRDEQKVRRVEVLRTNAWEDDGGHADYVLECDLVPVPPKRESSTAAY